MNNSKRQVITKKLATLPLLGILFSLATGCADKGQEHQMIMQRDLEELKLGEFIHLSTLIQKHEGVVCGLYPYDDPITDEIPYAGRIRQYLNIKQYSVEDDGVWALVLADQNTVTLSVFRRNQLNALSAREIQGYLEFLPEKFKPISCIDVVDAVIFKIKTQRGVLLC